MTNQTQLWKLTKATAVGLRLSYGWTLDYNGRTFADVLDEPDARDRAEYVLRAVNSHDALVAALRAIVALTNGRQPIDISGALMVAESALASIK